MIHKTPAWTRSEGKNEKGGLNAKGRASYNAETGGNLKAQKNQELIQDVYLLQQDSQA